MKTPMTKPLDPSFKCFFDLPAEIRVMVYKIYFANYVTRKSDGLEDKDSEEDPDEDDHGSDSGSETSSETGSENGSDDEQIEGAKDVRNSVEDNLDEETENDAHRTMRYRRTISGHGIGEAPVCNVLPSDYRDEVVINQAGVCMRTYQHLAAPLGQRLVRHGSTTTRHR